jgi:hypothetical protein
VDPDCLHHVFNQPEDAPVIAVIPVIFPVPVGLQVQAGKALDAGEISATNFACAAGHVWINMVAQRVPHFRGMPVHSDPAIFNAADLDVAPFSKHQMATTVGTSITMLLPSNEQHKLMLNVAQEAINAAKGQARRPTWT